MSALLAEWSKKEQKVMAYDSSNEERAEPFITARRRRDLFRVSSRRLDVTDQRMFGKTSAPFTMPTPKANTVDYVEVPSKDVGKSKAFFEFLVGWKFTHYGPDYVAFEDGRLNGGFFTSDKISSTASGAALVVIYNEDLEQMREKALKLGAKITRDTFSFPGGRRFQFAEPGGSEFALCSDK